MFICLSTSSVTYNSPLQITKSLFFTLFKVLLVIALVGSITNYLVVERDFAALLKEVYIDFSLRGYLCLALAVLLVTPNWLIESYKWKLSMDSYAYISFKDSVISVVSGVTLGILTPARVGEYAGRMVRVKKERYGQTVIATFLCSLSQLLVTLVIGGTAFLLLYEQLEFEGLGSGVLVYLGMAFFVFLLLSFLNLSKVISLLSRIKWVASMMEGLIGVDFSWGLQLRLIVLAAVRFIVYSCQYILVLRFCGVDLSWWLLFSHISMIFFLQSLLPLPPVAFFFARTGVALIVLGTLDINELVNVLSSVIIWIINLSIPALVGLYFIIIRKTESA